MNINILLDMENHINHCLDQLIRFSEMFKTKNIDSKERFPQFGYNLGRLIVFLDNLGIKYKPNPILNRYNIEMAALVISVGITNGNIIELENNLIDYGFAIGFIQETYGQNNEIWWKPISDLCAKEEWEKVSNLTNQNLNNFDIHGKINYYYPVFGSEFINWSSVQSNIVLMKNTVLSL